MSFIAGFLGDEDATLTYLFLATVILLTLPVLCSNFTSLLVVFVITSPLLFDFAMMLGNLPIKGDMHGYVALMNVLLLLPTPCTFLTRLGGLLMQRSGWSRQKAIWFDLAGVLLFVVAAYLYSEFGNVNPTGNLN